jgi:hypothetical protein
MKQVSPKRQNDVEALADQILACFQIKRGPVDPFWIASQEGIKLAPGDYGEDFSGRIEYHQSLGIFMLFHPFVETARYPSVVRFSVAHELAHYYIPEHAQLLQVGESHNSTSGFVCDNVLEREADYFAGSLLLPSKTLAERIGKRGWLNLESVLGLARDCNTSATSAAIRYASFTEEACLVVLSTNGVLRYRVPSQEAEAIGLKWPSIEKVPPTSVSERASQLPGAGQVFSGPSSTEYWFPSRGKHIELWEEAFPLGYTGSVLTLISLKA